MEKPTRYLALVNLPDQSILADVYLADHYEALEFENIQLRDKISELQKRIAELEKNNSELGWIVSPDRMGQ